MTAELMSLLNLAPDVLMLFFLVFLRIGAAMFVLPVFGEGMLSVRVRLTIALAFSFVVMPTVASSFGSLGSQDSNWGRMIFAEVLAGLLIGLLLRFHIMAIQVAASIAAQSTSLSQLLGTNSIDPQPALGMILYVAALALAVELGLHIQFAMMFIASYQIVGLGQPIGSVSSGILIEAASMSFRFGFVLAAPFVAMSLTYNLALGVINRAMPQLMVAFVGAPAITMGAIVLLVLAAPLMLMLWAEALYLQIQAPFGR